MQKSPKINHRKLIFQKILRNITFISLLNVLILNWKKSKNVNSDLQRPKPKKRITPELILVIIIMLIVIILPIILYTTGCMESTTYYNRGLG